MVNFRPVKLRSGRSRHSTAPLNPLNPMDGTAARRIMSSEYNQHKHIRKNSFASRAQRAAQRNMNNGYVDDWLLSRNCGQSQGSGKVLRRKKSVLLNVLSPAHHSKTPKTLSERFGSIVRSQRSSASQLRELLNSKARGPKSRIVTCLRME